MQEAIRESTGRSTDVECDQSLRRNLEVIEGAFGVNLLTKVVKGVTAE